MFISKILFLNFFILFFIASCSGDPVTEDRKSKTKQQQSSGGEISLYKVDGDRIIKSVDYKVSGDLLALQKAVDVHEEIWQLFARLIPKEKRIFVSEFLIYSGEIDGSAGFVTPRERSLKKWQLGIAIDVFYTEKKTINRSELTYVLLHEYGHILTLNNTQVNPGIDHSSCGNYHTGEGCSGKSSYINKLVVNYWKDILKEHNNAQNNEKLAEFYQKYSRRFVTPYASTNPGEDIAEVFAYFVLSRPVVGGIGKKKVELLKKHRELADLKDYIKTKIPVNFTMSKFSDKSFQCGSARRMK